MHASEIGTGQHGMAGVALDKRPEWIDGNPTDEDQERNSDPRFGRRDGKVDGIIYANEDSDDGNSEIRSRRRR